MTVAEKSLDVLSNRLAEDKQDDGIGRRRDVIEPIAHLIERVVDLKVGMHGPFKNP